MYRDIDFKQEARRDIKEIITWYEQQKAGLGFKFEASLEQLLVRMRRMPELGEQILPNIRRRQVGIFPYFVLYRVYSDRLFVLGVFHHHRDPSSWKDRIDMNGKNGHSAE